MRERARVCQLPASEHENGDKENGGRVGKKKQSHQEKHRPGKEEETPEGTDECENGRMGSEKDDTALEVRIGAGKRNSRLEQIEEEELT